MNKVTLPAKNCPKCERLCAFHEVNRQKYPEFYNGAVPSFGSLKAEFLVVGLAPGLKGANATGRPFTGDYAGDVLYPALARKGFMVDSSWLEGDKLPSDLFRSAYHQPLTINFELNNARITNAVRCVPPENKPTTQEIAECNPFLAAEIAAMSNLKVILTLGLVSHKAVLKALGQKQSAYKFAHSAVHSIIPSFCSSQSDGAESHAVSQDTARLAGASQQHDELKMLNSYHTSRYNVNTGRLTFEMFDEVIGKVRTLLTTTSEN